MDPMEMFYSLLCRTHIMFVSRGLKSHVWNSRQLKLIGVECTFRERLERIYELRVTLLTASWNLCDLPQATVIIILLTCMECGKHRL